MRFYLEHKCPPYVRYSSPHVQNPNHESTLIRSRQPRRNITHTRLAGTRVVPIGLIGDRVTTSCQSLPALCQASFSPLYTSRVPGCSQVSQQAMIPCLDEGGVVASCHNLSALQSRSMLICRINVDRIDRNIVLLISTTQNFVIDFC